MKNIKTTRFGEIEIDERQAIHFPEGILGFPEYKDYILIEHKPGSPFLWLQSLNSPDLAFITTNPFLIKKDYLENLSEMEKSLFEKEGENEIIVLSLVTIPHGKAGETTVNLLGPLVIDTKSRNAKQVILANSGYSHCHPMISG